MKYLSLALTALIATQDAAQALEFMGETEPAVEQLDYWNWNKVIDDDENAWVVTFYLESCRYCQMFEPELFKAANDS